MSLEQNNEPQLDNLTDEQALAQCMQNSNFYKASKLSVLAGEAHEKAAVALLSAGIIGDPVANAYMMAGHNHVISAEYKGAAISTCQGKDVDAAAYLERVKDIRLELKTLQRQDAATHLERASENTIHLDLKHPTVPLLDQESFCQGELQEVPCWEGSSLQEDWILDEAGQSSYCCIVDYD